jgi:glutaminyl-tRNA synthetase
MLAYFDGAARDVDAGTIARWVVNDLGPAIRAGASVPRPERLAPLLGLLRGGAINTKIVKDVLAEASVTGADPIEIVERRGLRQVSDSSALEPVVERVLARHPDKVEAYRAGKEALIGFFVGLVLKDTGGRANPQVVRDLIVRRLGRPSDPRVRPAT